MYQVELDIVKAKMQEFCEELPIMEIFRKLSVIPREAFVFEINRRM